MRGSLLKVIEAARDAKVTVFTDEVFSPLFFADPQPPSFISLGFADSDVTGSMSKSYGIPDIRIGWIISQNPVFMGRARNARDYTTISVSQLDDAVATYGLNEAVLPNLMKRNIAVCSESIRLLEGLVRRNPARVRWVKPTGAGTAFLQILLEDGTPVDDAAFSRMMAEEEGAGVAPGGHGFANGNVHDFEGYVRITLGSPNSLRDSLPLLESFIQRFGLPIDGADSNVLGQ